MINGRSVPDSRSALILVVAAFCALLLTACGTSTPNAPATTSASVASSSANSPAGTSPGATSAGETSAGGTSAGGTGLSGSAAGTTTLTGTIEAGVEAGCFVLEGKDGTVLANLLGVDSVTTPVGAVVEVTGTFEEDMMTTCQQGKPFSITTIEVG